MTDLLTVLILLVAVAALEAAIQAHDAPLVAPRRNYDVLFTEARVGATRRPSVPLSGPEWLVIRDERPVRHGE